MTRAEHKGEATIELTAAHELEVARKGSAKVGFNGI